MAKFKVGDKVRVKKDLDKIVDFNGGYVGGIKEWEGKIVTIRKVENTTHNIYCDTRYEFKECDDYIFDERALELIENRTITIFISDTKSTITDDNGVELYITRYYTTDKHDEKYVIKELTKRYIDELDRIEKEKNGIKVGDYVVVIYNGATYTTPNENWFDGVDIEHCLKFAYGVLPDNSEIQKYKVVAIIDKYNVETKTKYLISNGIATFLLAEYGLRKVE